jgi:intracellular septation protein
MNSNVLKSLLGGQLELPDAVWNKLNIAWVGFTAFMSISNGYVALFYSEEAWVSFKLWGFIFPLVFIVGQGIYIAPHMKGEDAAKEGPAP